MKKYLLLDSACFLWLDTNNNGLIYNSDTCKIYSFNINPNIRRICDELCKPINLYGVEVTENELSDSVFERWVYDLANLNIGQIKECKNGDTKPISIPPILKIVGLKGNAYYGEESLNENLITYLHEITIHVGASSHESNSPEQSCTPVNVQQIMSFEQVGSIISKVKSQYFKRVNILGDDILLHHDLPKIISLLNDLNTANTFIVNSQAVISASRSLNVLKDKNIELQVVCGPLDDLSEIENILIENSLKYGLSITVASEEEYDIADKKASNLKSGNYEIKPVYNGKNLEFFKEYVFFTEEDIADRKLCKREVFANQALNTNFFGKLTIMPDGETYANVNHPSLGNIFKDSIYEILYKEMDEGTSWRMTRDKEEPCKDCLYKYLCPSPSDYELVIGKMNLCHINQI